jgi:hypothetical protein
MALPTLYYANGTNYLLSWAEVSYGIIAPPGETRNVKGVNGEFYAWDGNTDNDPFPRLLDPNLWSYRRVEYPATILNMAGSIKAGADWTIARIKETPGPFALGGYSQGAAVAGAVYDACRQGELADRRSDLRGVVTFGSPVREAGHTYEGSSGYSGAFDIFGSTRGSHGVFPNRLKNTEPFVYDFVMPDEVITGVSDSPMGKLWTAAAGFLLSNNLALAAASFIPVASMVNAAAGAISVTDPLTGATFNPGGGGHVRYPFFPPPNSDGIIPASGDTCYQIGARFLNSVGAQIKEQMNPTVPTPTTKPTYQWFSSLASG